MPCLDLSFGASIVWMIHAEVSSFGFTRLERLGRDERGERFLALDREGRRVELTCTTLDEADAGAHAARARRAVEIARAVRDPRFFGPREIHTTGNLLVVVRDLPPGTPLVELLRHAPLEPLEAIEIARGIAEALAALHATGWVHGALWPTAVWPHGREVRIGGLGHAVRLVAGGAMIAPPRAADELRWCAPEQTGRLGRGVDERTDLYSLGALLHAALLGAPPFPEDDPLELVHAILAREPARGAPSRPLPPLLWELLARLLAKDPDRRYRTALGLAHDLDAIARRLREGAALEGIVLGARDHSDRLDLGGRLFGRDAQVALLASACERAAAGETRLVTIAGVSGSGKSALVREAHAAFARHHARVGTGKFDDAQRTVPFSAFAQAFRAVLHEVLSSSEAEVARFRDALSPRLAGNAQMLVELLPEIGLVLGPQPPAPPVAAQEAQNRLNLVFEALVDSLVEGGRPLALFLDDVQWADPGSLKLLSVLLSSSSRPLLVILAHRANEVTADHPYAITLASLKKTRLHVSEVVLEALALDEVARLVSHATHRDDEDARALAAVLHDRAAGNPLFVGQLLRVLHERGILRFSAETAAFQWDLAAVRALAVTDDVVQLMTSRLDGLGASGKQVLAIAACVGSTFDAALVAEVARADRADVHDALVRAANAGLLVAADDAGSGHAVSSFAFLHDRVREAAYRSLPEAERVATHLAIGRALDARGGDAASFEIVSQLNAGRCDQGDAPTRRRLSELNLEAARRAASVSAYESMLAYLDVAHRCLEPDAWSSRHAFCSELFRRRGEALALAGRFDEAEASFKEVISRSTDDLEIGHCYERWSEVLHWAGQTTRALETVLRGLELLGISFPTRPEDAEAETAAAFQRLVAPDAIERLAAASPGDDREKLVGRLYDRLIIGCYFAKPGDLGIVIARNLLRVLDHGSTPESCEAAGWFATLLAMRGELARSIDFARLALRMAESHDEGYFKGRASVLAYCMSLGWQIPFAESEAAFPAIFRLCHESGDFQYASYALLCEYVAAHVRGADAARMRATCEAWRDYCERYIPLELGQARIRCHVLAVMAGDAAEEDFDMASVVAGYDADGNFTDVCESLAEIAHLHVHQDRWEEAWTASEKAAPLLAAGAAGNLLIRAMATYAHGTAAARRLATCDAAEREETRARLDECLERLRSWAAFSPANFTAYALFVEAETRRADDEPELAAGAYRRAFEVARDAGQHRLAGHAAERLAQLLEPRDRRIARIYREDARDAYAAAGLRGLAQRVGSRDDVRTESRLDVLALVRASQALSGEIVGARLLERLMHLCRVEAGAQRALFLVNDGDAIRIEAASDDRAAPAEGRVPFCRSAVHYVARTGARLVVADASLDPRFSSDPHVTASKTRSLLCLPVVAKGRTLGLLYLENDLAPAVFDEERCRVLEVLAGQAAISLENARLYDTLELRVQERTRALDASLREVVASRERLAAELSEAAAYIRSLLPARRSGQLTIDWRFFPSAELGGDAFGYDQLPDGRVAIYLFDVCGHGMASALLSIAILTTLQSRRLPGADFANPSSVLSALNAAFPSSNHRGLFFTMWYGVLDPQARTLSYASAGHPGAVLMTGRSPKSLRVEELETHGPIIGMVPDVEFPASSVRLDDETRLFVFSDGVYEIEREDGRMLEYEAFLSELTRGADEHAGVDGHLDRMVRFAYASRGRPALDDDFSIVGLRLGA